MVCKYEGIPQMTPTQSIRNQEFAQGFNSSQAFHLRVGKCVGEPVIFGQRMSTSLWDYNGQLSIQVKKHMPEEW